MKYLLSFFALFLPAVVSAHVGYVVPQEQFDSSLGRDYPFAFDAIFHGQNWILMGSTILILLVLLFLSHKSYFIKTHIDRMTIHLRSYYEFIPWILRLSIGIALMGAGAKGVLISPVLVTQVFSGLELVTGFMLLSGFLLLPATIVSALLFLKAFNSDFYIFGNLDFFAISIALLILQNAKPGLDDILGIPKLTSEKLVPFVPFILRVGIGLALIFLSLFEKFLNPHLSEQVVNIYHLTNIINVPATMWIFSAGVIEFVVGICLLLGFQTRLVSVIAFLVITTTFFYFKEDVFSHITLFGTLSVLFVTGGGKWSLDRIWYKHS